MAVPPRSPSGLRTPPPSPRRPAVNVAVASAFVGKTAYEIAYEAARKIVEDANNKADALDGLRKAVNDMAPIDIKPTKLKKEDVRAVFHYPSTMKPIDKIVDDLLPKNNKLANLIKSWFAEAHVFNLLDNLASGKRADLDLDNKTTINLIESCQSEMRADHIMLYWQHILRTEENDKFVKLHSGEDVAVSTNAAYVLDKVAAEMAASEERQEKTSVQGIVNRAFYKLSEPHPEVKLDAFNKKRKIDLEAGRRLRAMVGPALGLLALIDLKRKGTIIPKDIAVLSRLFTTLTNRSPDLRLAIDCIYIVAVYPILFGDGIVSKDEVMKLKKALASKDKTYLQGIRQVAIATIPLSLAVQDSAQWLEQQAILIHVKHGPLDEMRGYGVAAAGGGEGGDTAGVGPFVEDEIDLDDGLGNGIAGPSTVAVVGNGRKRAAEDANVGGKRQRTTYEAMVSYPMLNS